MTSSSPSSSQPATADATADATATKKQSSMMLFLQSCKTFFATEHVEVTLRITLSMLFCYSVSFWNAPILNPNTRLLLAVIGPFVILLVPTLMFAFGGIILPMAVLFLLAYGFVTLLLVAAVAGGDGAFCVVITILLFWCSFLRWEKATGPGTSILIIATVFVAVLAFPNYRTVQEGFDVIVETASGSDGIDSVPNDLLPAKNTVFEFLSLRYGPMILEYLKNNNDNATTFEIQTGDLAGLEVEVLSTGTVGDDEYAIVHVPGGMWLVSAMWTTTGVNNPLAAFQNLFIFWGWLFGSLAIVYFVPPFRTLRLALSKGMIPSALKDASTLIELHSDEIHAKKDNNNNSNENEKDAVDSTKQIQQIKGNLVRHVNVLFGGNLAKLTAFEPQLSMVCNASLPVCTWLRLKGVSDAVLKCVLVAIGIQELVHEQDDQQLMNLTKSHLEATKSLKSCALALQIGKTSCIVDVNKETTKEKKGGSDPFRMNVHTKAVVESTKSYLLAMEGKRSTNTNDSDAFFSQKTLTEIKLSMLPFYVVFTAYVFGLIGVLKMLFRKSYWSSMNVAPYNEFYKFVWCIKYTAGFVILLVMAVYWDGYNENFSIHATLPKGQFGAVFSTLNGGWTIIAYCFATTQSTEGSVKKGILRCLGTVSGGFFGWLALIACEDSSFDSGFNSYGLVAWLTITTAAATYSATNRGFFARLGLSGDYSFGPIYFVITEVIVVMYCFLYFGPAGRHDVAINRIVSNLVGIVLAMLLTFVPPGVWGGDPSHCREIVDRIEGSSHEYLEILLESQGITDKAELEELSKKILRKKDDDLAAGIRLHGLAKDLFDDASRLSAAPFLKVDGRLTLELALISRDVYVASYLGILASRIVSNPNFRKVALEDRNVRSSIQSFQQTFQTRSSMYGSVSSAASGRNKRQSLTSDLEEADRDEIKEAKLLVELFLRISQMIQQRLESHHRSLDEIKWGYTFRSNPKNTETEVAM